MYYALTLLTRQVDVVSWYQLAPTKLRYLPNRPL